MDKVYVVFVDEVDYGEIIAVCQTLEVANEVLQRYVNREMQRFIEVLHEARKKGLERVGLLSAKLEDESSVISQEQNRLEQMVAVEAWPILPSADAWPA